MKKDRLFLLDETVVPGSLTQLREVTSLIKTQIVIFHSASTCFLPSPLLSTFSRFTAPFLLSIKSHQEVVVKLGWLVLNCIMGLF